MTGTSADNLPAIARSIDSKLPSIGTTIFTRMNALAGQHDAINLAQGFPEFNPPADLLQKVSERLNAGHNQYAPMAGVPALLEVIADKTRRFQGRTVDPEEEITICCGATEGLFTAVQALVRPGDEVIVLDPAYDSYEPAVTLAGGQTIHVPLAISGGEFAIDWARLATALNDKTRLLIVNFPHNPSGALLSPEDLKRLAELLRDTACLLLADEVYEHIVFDGARHHSVLTNEELWQRSVVVSSFGKTLHATGWKIGYVIAPGHLTREFRKVHQYVTFSISTPVQHAIADFLSEQPDYCHRLASFYQKKRDSFCRRLTDSRFRLTPARSTFFQLLDYSGIDTSDDLDVALRWTERHRIASIPLSVFCETPFTGHHLRFCFAKDDATLARAAQVLSKLSADAD